MGDFFKKAFYKIKILIRPHGFSRIKSGVGKGLLWSHQVSDLRYLTGSYEPELSDWLKQKIVSGKSFVDIGANAGYFSLLANHLSVNTQQRIVAIEPIQANIDLINKHLNLNGAIRVELMAIAVADENRTVEFSTSSNLSANTYSAESSVHKNNAKISIQAKNLDAICQELNMVNFVVKIDVEGAELDVLKGAVNVLSLNKPELILATHECHVKGVEQQCLDFLKTKSYICELIKEEKFVQGQQDYLCRYQA